MLRPFRADLHIHTCLSPCTELDMSPRKIIASALDKGIDIIGICDHNSSENSQAVINAAKNSDVCVIPGMEVTSEEEVHILALFDLLENVMKLQEYVYKNLPGENDEDAFGKQVIVNEEEEVLGFNKRLLIGATTLPLEDVIRLIHSLEGLAIASHIDRETFSILGQLGFIPDHLDLDALEVSPKVSAKEAREKYRAPYPITSSSDAHYPNDIGKSFTPLLLESGTVAEIRKALRNEDGRQIIS